MKNITLLAAFLFAAFSATAQTIQFDMVDVFSIGYNGVTNESTFDLEGEFRYDSSAAVVFLKEEGITEAIKVIGTQKTDLGGVLIFGEDGSSFVLFKNFVTTHRTFRQGDKLKYVERRLYSTLKNI